MHRDESASFEIRRPERGVASPLLCHVPHSATKIPARWRREILLSDSQLARELVAMTDHHTDALFVPSALESGGVAFVNRVSRLVCDPERFEDDDLEEMSKKGMGAVYTLTSDGRPLRRPGYSAPEREKVLDELFRPYAEALAREVSALLERFGRCLIIDAHSFPSAALAYEDAHLERPDICLGTDSFHTPPSLVESLEQVVRDAGWQVSVNSPFAGSYVPSRFLNNDPRIVSVMIEMNRARYLDERTGEPGPEFEATRALVENLIETAASFQPS